MIVFTEDCDRDLKREAAAAASFAQPAGAGAGKEAAGVSVRRVPLARLPPNESAAEARPAGAAKKRKASTAEAGPAAAGKKMEEATAAKKMEEATAAKKMKEGDSLLKEGEMLKLRDEYWEAVLLWKEEREKAVWGAPSERKTTQVAVAAVDTKQKQKKKKVVREILPDGYIAYISENSCMMTELSEEEMAECPEPYRQSYAMTKIINAKKRAYHQALIDQHRAFGYAYDEKEVTDEDEEAVVKN